MKRDRGFVGAASSREQLFETGRLKESRANPEESLFAIHFGDDPSQLGGLRGGQLIDSVSQTLLADGSYLIYSYFSRFSRTLYL
jgi:hypothetical protein